MNCQRTCHLNRLIMPEEPYEITPCTPKRHRPRMPLKFGQDPPRTLQDFHPGLPQVSRPRNPEEFASTPQGLCKSTQEFLKDFAKTPHAICKTSPETPRGSRPSMPPRCGQDPPSTSQDLHQNSPWQSAKNTLGFFFKDNLRASPPPTATNEAASNKHTGRPSYRSITQGSAKKTHTTKSTPPSLLARRQFFLGKTPNFQNLEVWCTQTKQI